FVHPMAIRVMKEKGIDISDHTSKSISSVDLGKITMLVTLCGEAEEACPQIPTKISRYHWPFADPCRVLGSEETRLNSFRQVRDAIELKVKQFIDKDLCD
ncbi:MAG: arsenate reductase ArsC, partial [Deltaproteobacteria bacterium]|nr:arsenate reductase ArsC [Deltaproteobacteria bacterium]